METVKSKMWRCRMARPRKRIRERYPLIASSDAADKARHDRMVELVNRMLELHRQLAGARTEHDKTTLTRQIEATDRQIDRLVYELYDLTEEEIAIVEGMAPLSQRGQDLFRAFLVLGFSDVEAITD